MWCKISQQSEKLVGSTNYISQRDDSLQTSLQKVSRSKKAERKNNCQTSLLAFRRYLVAYLGHYGNNVAPETGEFVIWVVNF